MSDRRSMLIVDRSWPARLVHGDSAERARLLEPLEKYSVIAFEPAGASAFITALHRVEPLQGKLLVLGHDAVPRLSELERAQLRDTAAWIQEDPALTSAFHAYAARAGGVPADRTEVTGYLIRLMLLARNHAADLLLWDARLELLGAVLRAAGVSVQRANDGVALSLLADPAHFPFALSAGSNSGEGSVHKSDSAAASVEITGVFRYRALTLLTEGAAAMVQLPTMPERADFARAATSHGQALYEAQDRVRDLLASALTETIPQRRGILFEEAVNELFRCHGILIRSSFRKFNEKGPGVMEQIDGVIEMDGDLYLVEIKCLAGEVSVDDVSRHLVRVYHRHSSRGLFVSATPFSSAALRTCIEALQNTVVTLCLLDEIIEMLERHGDLADLLRAKVRAAVIDKAPFVRVGTQSAENGSSQVHKSADRR